MAQVTTSTTVHDVVVVGSGAGGGTVTKVLADLGVSGTADRGRSDGRAGGFQGAPLALPGAASRRRRQGAGLHRRPDRFHLQRDVSAARSSRASPTPWRPAATSRGSARACSAAAPTTMAASSCACPTTTSSRRPPTASASTGRSPMRIWRPTTTRPSASSASPARPKAFAARRTASSTRRRRSARTTR